MENPSLYFMGSMYILAGLAHFWKPKAYMKIMPAYIPYHLEMVYLSGVLEVLFGALVMIPATQVVGAWGLIAVLIGVFPANIDMALKYKGKKLWWKISLWLRLPVQLWLIYWAWMFVQISLFTLPVRPQVRRAMPKIYETSDRRSDGSYKGSVLLCTIKGSCRSPLMIFATYVPFQKPQV